ncbi:Mitochondrial intermediate peptidase [Spiromyces aspiralis]|uniref:Mitochondrial intermediate peptidase n=1 Tax=Spiromyces aspiralis TaxID=68401 RepID=A0ACC1HJ11_9FUNG|nr:Mitochondrial intermediate peptidase [Spiromyces aspiralis]
MARLTAGARDVLPDLSPYFSLGRVMSGLSRLLTHLYGIELRPVAPRPGELWHPEIRKLEVVDADGGSRLLGIIYCDVFARPGKTNVGAAHFTVRCSRRVDDDLAFPELDPETAGSNETIFADRSSGKVFQLPLVVLTCDFSPPTPRSPCLLSPGEVKTLFHEMGHAMHSMLGQTGYHNVAGTRCPVDFVELPSILMEHFALTPPVLQLFASHHQTNQPLQPGLVTQHKRLQSQVGTMDVHSQLFMSALDQKYHSEDLGLGDDSTCRLEREFDWSTKVLADMQNSPDFGGGDRLTFPHVEGTRWQTRFGHLIGYGASYYSYLFDRVLAGKIWQSMFSPEIRHKAGGPLSREGGERFKTEVLRWGGGRDPWVSLAALLDHSDAGLSPRQVELLGRGGQAAVEIVGSWGLYGRDLP